MRTLPFRPLIEGSARPDVSAEIMLCDDAALAIAGPVDNAVNKIADDREISFIVIILGLS